MSLRTLRIFLFSAPLALSASLASAQSLEEEQADAETAPADEELAPARLDDEQAEVQLASPEEAARSSTDPYEEPGQDYFFLGAFYRHVFIPGAIQGLFVEGGIDGSNPAAGLSFNWRKDNLNVIANVWWNNAQGEGFFRADGDPETDMEYIDVDLGAVFFSAEILWAFPLADWFAIELGFDIGFGLVYGDLVRSEAYPTTDGSGETTWNECQGPGDPGDGTGRNFCEGGPAQRDVDGNGTISGSTSEPPGLEGCYDSNGAHYNCREENWFRTGGDVPVIVPWIALPHFALRFKPIRQLQIRIDVAYNIVAVSFGAGAYFGF